jgi:hypothetical protein
MPNFKKNTIVSNKNLKPSTWNSRPLSKSSVFGLLPVSLRSMMLPKPSSQIYKEGLMIGLLRRWRLSKPWREIKKM